MKFVVAFAALVAVAVASPYLKPIDSSLAELEAIIAAIQSPSTDPATAALLEEQLAGILGDLIPQPAPVFVEEPAVIVEEPAPISIGPAILDFPVPDGGALTAGLTPVETPVAVEAPIVPGPVVIGGSTETSPLVQIIVNVNKANAATPIVPAPVEAPVLAIDPVMVVDEAVNVDTIVPTPVHVVETAPEPIQVVEVAPEPVQVVEVAPVQVEPIQIGTPVIPTPVEVAPIQIGTPVIPIPVVTLPDILN